MKTPFYINPDVLEKPWGSKHDFLIVILFIIALVGANLAFLGITTEKLSVYAKGGIGGTYIGCLIGVILHLGKQIKRGDEFAGKITAQAIAHAGLTTILFVAIITVFHAVRGINNLAMWNLTAPIFFLFIAYLTARSLARNYAQ